MLTRYDLYLMEGNSLSPFQKKKKYSISQALRHTLESDVMITIGANYFTWIMLDKYNVQGQKRYVYLLMSLYFTETLRDYAVKNNYIQSHD